MHIFLTGEIQVGKSTVISKALSFLNITPEGFRTYFGPDRWSQDKLLYMNAAAEPKIYHPDKAIVRFTNNQPPCVLTETFENYGVGLIRSARKHSRLILMDECGRLEKNASTFQREILESLEEKIPVLGVIKLASSGWTDNIKNHPQVTLLEVTKENRDNLPEVLIKLLRQNLLLTDQQ